MSSTIARKLLLRASRSQWLARRVARRPFVLRAVSRFMPGEDAAAALSAAAGLAGERTGTVLTWLGERTSSAAEAAMVRDHYLELLGSIRDVGLPAHISIKPSHLGLDVDGAACREAVLALTRRAEAAGSFVWIDMEESWYVDRTLDLFRAARSASTRVGVCLQAYLRRTAADLDDLIAHAAAVDGGGVAVRLVKGAYGEAPELAFQHRHEVDDAFVRLAGRLLAAAGAPSALPVLGTHDIALVDRIRTAAEEAGTAPDAWEIHMLYGIRTSDQRALAAQGLRVRTLISYGRNWFPWYMRRLAERPANVWFVVRSLISR